MVVDEGDVIVVEDDVDGLRPMWLRMRWLGLRVMFMMVMWL